MAKDGTYKQIQPRGKARGKPSAAQADKPAIQAGEKRRQRMRTMKARMVESTDARLVVLTGAGVGCRFDLPSVTVIGRDQGATIALEDGEVSRNHAVISRDPDGGFTLADAKSRNGTWVNGKRITQHQLELGDRIRMGSHELLFTRHGPLESQVVERQKFEALGRLSAGFAHDFKNMLGIVSANCDYLNGCLTEPDEADEARECLQDMVAAVNRADQLARRLVTFARGEQHGHRVVDMGDVCHELVKLLRGSFPRSITIECDADQDLTVLGDAGELYQALMNLMLNARDAMSEGGGTLTIEARHARGAKPCAAIRITDTGRGMTDETKARLFEPFYSTKGKQGFGLGLANVRTILAAHGGKLDFDSDEGRGTTFLLTLPLQSEPTSKPHRPSFKMPRVDSAATATIMVVDDEALARRGAARLLKREGYQVIEAEDGRQAVKMYIDAKRAPDLVLLDFDMPFLDGGQTFHLLLGMDEDARVLLCTGRADDGSYDALVEAGVLGILDKPYSEEELLARVAEAVSDEPLFIVDEPTLEDEPTTGSFEYVPS
jgi:signal transduction histidine kinase/ActR/RegA family two-component response regulator